MANVIEQKKTGHHFNHPLTSKNVPKTEQIFETIDIDGALVVISAPRVHVNNKLDE